MLYEVITGHITVSIGGATEIPKHGKDPASLLAEADRMLYRAKEGGRNRVEWRPENPPRLRQVNRVCPRMHCGRPEQSYNFV